MKAELSPSLLDYTASLPQDTVFRISFFLHFRFLLCLFLFFSFNYFLVSTTFSVSTTPPRRRQQNTWNSLLLTDSSIQHECLRPLLHWAVISIQGLTIITSTDPLEPENYIHAETCVTSCTSYTVILTACPGCFEAQQLGPYRVAKNKGSAPRSKSLCIIVIIIIINGVLSASWVQLRNYLKEKVAAPVQKSDNTDVGIRHANHVAPSILKSWH
jgi:hypothetical protein